MHNVNSNCVKALVGFFATVSVLQLFLLYTQGSNDDDSEDDRIPGLHSDVDNTDSGNVVLVKSRDVGTLPRRHRKVGSCS